MGVHNGTQQAPDRATVPVSSLLPADSPRSLGEDEAHIARLAEVDAVLPPLLVHRPTMRVIDGMHRLRTAILKGRASVEVEFFDGSEEEAFARGVELNTSHGLPLSVLDRKAAATRILAWRPALSDRAVAAITGLAAKTVAALRAAGSTGGGSPVRTGIDGRQRPLDGGEGRHRAAALIRDEPDLPLRVVAASAGISLGTAYDVRSRLRAGQDPVRDGSLAPRRLAEKPVPRNDPPAGRSAILRDLLRDPAVRFNERGRELLRLLHSQGIQRGDWTRLVGSVPPHCAPGVAKLAHQYAEEWRTLARHLDRRTKN